MTPGPLSELSDSVLEAWRSSRLVCLCPRAPRMSNMSVLSVLLIPFGIQDQVTGGFRESLGTSCLSPPYSTFCLPQMLPGASGEEPACKCRRLQRCRLDPGVKESLEEATDVLQYSSLKIPRRSLVGYGPSLSPRVRPC